MNGRNYAPGLILIALGIFFAVVELTGVGAEAVVAVIGGAVLVAYAATRKYGFLVAGGILTGLGLGIVWEVQQTAANGAPVLIGLGSGFLDIYVVDLAVRSSTALWWPVIPGGIVGTIGALLAFEAEGVLRDLNAVWPIVLVVVGALLLVVEMRRRATSSDDREPTGQPTS